MFFKIGVLKKKNSGQEHPQEVFCKKRYFQKISQISAPVMESFPVKFAKILRTSFFTEHLLWLFLTTILFFIAPENIKKPVVF